jgi:hypothetical protein
MNANLKRPFSLLLLSGLLAACVGAQTIGVDSISTTNTQAVIKYHTNYTGGPGACTLQAADMDRGITIATASATSGTVTVTTVAPHGLLTGAIVRIEGTGVWDGWQTPLVTASGSTFTFASATPGSGVTKGNVGVLSDDLNHTLYPGSNLGSRVGNVLGTFVVGRRGGNAAPIASDTNKYSRALQTNARYLANLTCGSTTTADFQFRTATIPVGNTFNSQAPSADTANPGQYALPTIQWPNPAQALIDPTTGIRSYRATGPLNTLSSATSFVTAYNPPSSWTNSGNAITGSGVATFTSSGCGSGPCSLFLRADNFIPSGGATGTTAQTGVSVDSYKLTVASAACATGTCQLNACLTINSVTCASTQQTQSLTTTPTTKIFGTGGIMDLLQPTGTQPPFSRADAATPVGRFTYVASTGIVTWSSGNKFSPNWIPGSTITIAGSGIAGSYVIASVLNENTLTLAAGPSMNLGTAIAVDSVSINAGGTSYTVGQSLVFTGGTCTSTPVATILTVNGVTGAITSILMNDVGMCTVAPAVTVASGGSGSGATLTGNLGAMPFTAPNFGAFVWITGGSGSVGLINYVWGSSPMQPWPADAKNSSSPPVTLDGTTTGKPGYDVFVGSELFWFAADGSQSLDLGASTLLFNGTSIMAQQGCGTSNGYYMWDPDVVNYPDTWYCIASTFGSPIPARFSFIKVQYNTTGTSNPIHSTHLVGTPGGNIPNCTSVSFPIPCLLITVMQPLAAQTITQGGTTFNPDYAASGFTTTANWFFAGTSPEGQITTYGYGVGQDTPGWIFIYNLGDRTPMGTDAGSMSQIAAFSTYRQAPATWCTIHAFVTPAGGWTKILNNGTFAGAQGAYVTSLTSAGLGSTGSTTCPANPFGVPTVGNLCDTITVSQQPISSGTPSTIQNIQQGDLMIIGALSGGAPPNGGEVLKVLTVPTGGGLTFTVQRASQGSTSVAHLTGVNMTMECGTLNSTDSAFYTLNNFIADPLGQNFTWTTVVNDKKGPGGHGWQGGGIPNSPVTILYGNTGTNFSPATLCPAPNAGCILVRDGYLVPDDSTQRAVSINPPFAGVKGLGDPNDIDLHPGACFGGYCMNAQTFNGASGSSLTFAPVAGKISLWKATGATLQRKFIPTFAYVGKWPLVDISGPGSIIVDGPTANYQYCYVNVINECITGSAIGNVYINAPFVYPLGTCPYPGVAIPFNDDAPPCIGDLGASAGNLSRFGYTATAGDLMGSSTQPLGSNYVQWNNYSVFWASQVVPSGIVLASNVPWLGGIRTDDLVNIIPPYPTPDAVTRSTFEPVTITIPAPAAALNVSTAIVEFGYGDYAGTNTYYLNCTTRQETCVTVSGSVNLTTPFYFETSESGSYSGLTCSSGCTPVIPALAQRVLYYTYKFLNSSAQVVATSRMNVIVTP